MRFSLRLASLFALLGLVSVACGGSEPPPARPHAPGPARLTPPSAPVVDAGATEDAAAPPPVLSSSATTLASRQGDVVDVDVDGPWVYWLTGDAIVKRTHTAGGPAATVADFGPESTRFLRVVGGNAYTAVTSTKTKATTIYRTNASLSNKPESIGTATGYFAFLAADKSHVVWATYDGAHKLSIFVLEAGQKTARRLPPIPDEAAAPHAVLTATDAYFRQDAKIESISLKTGKVTTVVALNGAEQMLTDFTIAGDRLYASVWETDHGDILNVKSASIVSAPLTGGAPTVLFKEDKRNVFDLVADATNLYWIDRPMPGGPSGAMADGRIMKLPLVGGTPSMLVAHEKMPNGLAIDDDSIYWTSESPTAATADGNILKIAK